MEECLRNIQLYVKLKHVKHQVWSFGISFDINLQ